MNTVILKWNPAFSSYSMSQYLGELYNLVNYHEYDFNWSVWDYDKIHAGDRYYWVKLGYGQTGIVSSGTITSDPYQGEDWSGKGRKTYYVDFEPDVMINPDTLPILTSQELSNEMPDFDWSKGHSGVVLNEQQSTSVEILWKNFIERNQTLWQKALEGRHKDQLWMEKK
ncbi:MAG: hypothetical protein IJP79_00130 [Paludibacteraceae bacterium]|nr:hypothetical protein [Paludibacteraceae bacterium]